jgi:DNA repair exonuclease SbcCD ATPase subunit
MEGDCAAWLSRCHQFVTQRLQPALESLEIMEVPVTTGQVKQAIEHLEALQDVLTRLKELHREQEEYRKVKHSFAVIAEVIQDRAAALVNDVVATLRDDVQSIYQMIHPTDAVPNIHIEPDTESRTLSVRVDFHSPDRAVPPAGYLSESQINTLGLALFISSVGLFNRQFPFLFLDDVFSSYDADHRERIVDLVAERLDRFQVFLTTHDEVFYSMLKDRLHDKGWLFERISGWDFEHGPQRETAPL